MHLSPVMDFPGDFVAFYPKDAEMGNDAVALNETTHINLKASSVQQCFMYFSLHLNSLSFQHECDG